MAVITATCCVPVVSTRQNKLQKILYLFFIYFLSLLCQMKNRFKEKIRWGIIGCGDVTEVKSGPALQLAEGSELVAVMRRTEKLAEDYAKRHNVPYWYDDADKIIYHPDIDAVYIATPPDSHKEYCLRTAAAGKPVYVEKPMALKYSETLEMISACEKAGVPLFVAYYRRALPRFLKVKSLIDERVIGDVEEVKINFSRPARENDIKGIYHWKIDPLVAGNGYFYDIGCHTLDLIQYFFGEIKEASGVSRNTGKHYKADDLFFINFTFGSGLRGSGHWNFNAESRTDEVIVKGTKGEITFASFDNNPVILKVNGNNEEFFIPHPPHIQQPLIQTIVNELLGKGTCPSTGKTASNTNWVMEQVIHSD